jgi:hypothetical protein
MPHQPVGVDMDTDGDEGVDVGSLYRGTGLIGQDRVVVIRWSSILL